MRVAANVRPRGLRKGVSTKSFYKGIGYKDPHGPDVRDVVGTLTLSVTQRPELAFLAAMREFFVTDKPCSLAITIDGKVVEEMTRNNDTAAEEQSPEPTSVTQPVTGA